MPRFVFMISERRKQAIIEMAKRGTPEEQKIAQSIINNLDISIEDEKIIQVEFKYKTIHERHLIHQIYAMIIDSFNGEYYTSKKKTKTVWFDMTKSQELEMSLLYSIYKRELEEEIEITYSAFIQTNRIFPQTNIDNPENGKMKNMSRILDRAGTINKTHIRKQIGATI